MHDSVSCANGFWSRKFGLKIHEHIWSLLSLVTKETKLRVLQWKILHNIYPTNILLCKMKVRDDRMCPYCNNVIDYIEHFFFGCPTIKKFWNYIEQHIVITFDIQTHLTVVDVLFGIKQHNYGKIKTKRINNVVLIAKMCISMHDVHVRGKKSYKNMWMREWKEYCIDGWICLNKRPNNDCLEKKEGEKKEKKKRVIRKYWANIRNWHHGRRIWIHA